MVLLLPPSTSGEIKEFGHQAIGIPSVDSKERPILGIGFTPLILKP